jgi:hypothetical protein
MGWAADVSAGMADYLTTGVEQVVPAAPTDPRRTLSGVSGFGLLQPYPGRDPSLLLTFADAGHDDGTAYTDGRRTQTAKGRNRGMGTVRVRLALWGFEHRTRHRRCRLMSGRAVAVRAGTDGQGG